MSTISTRLPKVCHPLSNVDRRLFSVSGRSRGGIRSADWPAYSRSLSVDDFGGARTRARRLRSNISTGVIKSLGDGHLSVEEVILKIEQKLQRSNGVNEVRKLFRSNDPSGEGKVSKEAFGRIIWCICGYVPPSKINAVIKRMQLYSKSAISFSDLVNFYQQQLDENLSSNLHQKRSMIFTNKNNLNQQAAEHETKVRSIDAEVEASKMWQEVKDKITQNNSEITHLFPGSCFGPNAYILPGQLRECCNSLGFQVPTLILAQMMRKICGNPYVVRSKDFFKILGMDFNGKPLETALSSSTRKDLDDKTAKKRLISTAPNIKEKQLDQHLAHRSKTSVGRDKMTKFNGDLADFIQKKLNQGHGGLIDALTSKDHNNDGMIYKSELRDVLKSFGFRIKAVQLEHFLSRSGIRRKDGLVSYKLLLKRLQSRTRLGILFKIINNSNHIFHSPNRLKSSNDDLSAALLECKLIRIFQKDFFLLLSSFKEIDSSQSGYLDLQDVKSVLESHFSIKISDKSWNTFKSSDLIQIKKKNDKKEEVSYAELLSMFDITKESSDTAEIDPWVQEMDVSYLREHKIRYLQMMGADPGDHTLRHDPQPLHHLEFQLVDVLLKKFINFKKEYDLSVREDFRRVDKEKFDYVMFRCGFILTPDELQRLWLSMPITWPMESLSFAVIIKHVTQIYYSIIRPEKFKKSTKPKIILEEILEKIRKIVCKNWKELKTKFRSLDPFGTSRIFKHQLVEILESLHLKISLLEIYFLVEMLESRIAEKSDYMKMLQFYVNHKSKKFAGMTKTKENENDTGGVLKTYIYKRDDTMNKMKSIQRKLPEKNSTNSNHQFIKSNKIKSSDFNSENKAYKESSNTDSVSSLIKRKVQPFVHGVKIGSLSRMLRKQDQKKTGKIPVKSFLDALNNHGVSFDNPNDFYKLLSKYDRGLNNEVKYGTFLKALV